MSNKTDASGLLYMRNRYYDPASGRFTQEDPIGIAGGLNLYGFAAGDPVNFSDPFGLCPEERRNDDGTCPGGLTVREWDRVEYAANNHLTSGARDRVLELLNDGKVHSDILAPRVNAKTSYDGEVTVNVASRNGNVFETSADFLGYVLAHESEHVQQFAGLSGFVRELRWRYGGQDYRDSLENRAYAYGCANTKSVTMKRLTCNP